MNGMDNNIQNGTVSNNNVQVMENNVSMDSNSPKKSNKSLLIVIGIIVAVILVVGVCGLFGYKAYVSKPINLYKGVIEETYESFSDILEEIVNSETFDIKEDSLVMNGSLKLTSNMPEMEDYTKYNYDFNLGLDAKNKKLEMGASMNEDSKEVIKAMFYLLDKTMYLSSEQAYDKVLYGVMEDDFFGELTSEEGMELPLTYEEIDKMVEKLSKYLANALDEDAFKEEKATITVNGKEVKVTKVIYPINQENVYEIANSMLKDIKNDDEFIELYAKLLGVEKSEVEIELENTTINKDDFEMEEEVKFYLYTKGFFAEVIGFGLDVDKNVISYAKVEELAELNLKGEGFEVVAKTNDTKTTGSIKVDNEEILSFTLLVEEKGNNEKIDLSVTMKEEEEEVVLDLVMDITEESDKKAKGTIDAKLSVTELGETMEIGAKLTINAEIGGKVEGFNTNGAVDYSSLTDAELEKIQTNLEKTLEGTFLYDLLFAEDEWESEDDWYYEDDDDWYYEDEASDI